MPYQNVESLYTRFSPDPDDPRLPLDYPLWAPNFTSILAETGNIGLSCEAAGITPNTFRRYRFGDKSKTGKQANAQFGEEVDQALDLAVERLRLVATRRATAPGGSDKLLILLLKAHDPALYNPPRIVQHQEDPQVLMRVEEMRARILKQLGKVPELPEGTPDPVDAVFHEERI